MPESPVFQARQVARRRRTIAIGMGAMALTTVSAGMIGFEVARHPPAFLAKHLGEAPYEESDAIRAANAPSNDPGSKADEPGGDPQAVQSPKADALASPEANEVKDVDPVQIETAFQPGSSLDPAVGEPQGKTGGEASATAGSPSTVAGATKEESGLPHSDSALDASETKVRRSAHGSIADSAGNVPNEAASKVDLLDVARAIPGVASTTSRDQLKVPTAGSSNQALGAKRVMLAHLFDRVVSLEGSSPGSPADRHAMRPVDADSTSADSTSADPTYAEQADVVASWQFLVEGDYAERLHDNAKAIERYLNDAWALHVGDARYAHDEASRAPMQRLLIEAMLERWRLLEATGKPIEEVARASSMRLVENSLADSYPRLKEKLERFFGADLDRLTLDEEGRIVQEASAREGDSAADFYNPLPQQLLRSAPLAPQRRNVSKLSPQALRDAQGWRAVRRQAP